MKKIKDVQAILDWFGNERKHVHDVLEITNNTVFWRLYRTEKLFIFDETDRTYRRNNAI